MNFKRKRSKRLPGKCLCCASPRWYGNRRGRLSDKDHLLAAEFKAFRYRNKIAS